LMNDHGTGIVNKKKKHHPSKIAERTKKKRH